MAALLAHPLLAHPPLAPSSPAAEAELALLLRRAYAQEPAWALAYSEWRRQVGGPKADARAATPAAEARRFGTFHDNLRCLARGEQRMGGAGGWAGGGGSGGVGDGGGGGGGAVAGPADGSLCGGEARAGSSSPRVGNMMDLTEGERAAMVALGLE